MLRPGGTGSGYEPWSAAGSTCSLAAPVHVAKTRGWMRASPAAHPRARPLPREPRQEDRVISQPLPALTSQASFVLLRVVDTQSVQIVTCDLAKRGSPPSRASLPGAARSWAWSGRRRRLLATLYGETKAVSLHTRRIGGRPDSTPLSGTNATAGLRLLTGIVYTGPAIFRKNRHSTATPGPPGSRPTGKTAAGEKRRRPFMSIVPVLAH